MIDHLIDGGPCLYQKHDDTWSAQLMYEIDDGMAANKSLSLGPSLQERVDFVDETVARGGEELRLERKIARREVCRVVDGVEIAEVLLEAVLILAPDHHAARYDRLVSCQAIERLAERWGCFKGFPFIIFYNIPTTRRFIYLSIHGCKLSSNTK